MPRRSPTVAEPPTPGDKTSPGPRSHNNISFSGASGQPYRFQIWPMETRFKPMAAVYFVTHRAYRNRTYHTASHDVIYIGHTDNLAKAFGTAAQPACFVKHEANCVCVLPLADPARRIAVVEDLLGMHTTHCNNEGRSKPLIDLGNALSWMPARTSVHPGE